MGWARAGRSGARAAVAIAAVLTATAALLLWAGRPPICTCGTVRLFEGAVQSAENSQQIADWYTPSHVVHGLIFYAVLAWLLPRRAIAWRLVAAVAVEAAWELIENSPMVIERYRKATIALGYTGDSVLNSMADIGWMMLGFWLARKLPVAGSIALAVSLELAALFVIRDNLTLNVVMLLWPIEAVKTWQGSL